MKLLSQFVSLAGFLALFQMGCERHQFEDTKGLHMEHGKHHDDHEAHDNHAENPKNDPADQGKKEKAAEPVKTEEPRDTGL